MQLVRRSPVATGDHWDRSRHEVVGPLRPRFWYDFVVGDDWVLAVFVVLGVAATTALVSTGTNPWWLLPVIVLLALPASLSHAARGPSASKEP